MSPGYRPAAIDRQTMRTPALERAAGVLASRAIVPEMLVDVAGVAGTDSIAPEMLVDTPELMGRILHGFIFTFPTNISDGIGMVVAGAAIATEMLVDIPEPVGGLLYNYTLTHSTSISDGVRGAAVARSPLLCGCGGPGATGRATSVRLVSRLANTKVG